MKQIIPSRINLTRHTGLIDGKNIYKHHFLNPMQHDVSKNDKRRRIKIPTVISEDLAYLCGIFAGDGSIGYRRKKNEYSLKVVGNPKDEKEFYNQIIGPKFKKVFGMFPRMKYHDSKTTYGFSIYSKTIYLYLVDYIKLPSGVKYATLKIPEIFLKSFNLTIAFVRGVFDTDGCVCFKKGNRKYANYPNISISSKSESFIKEISDFLRTTDLKFSKPYEYKQVDSRFKAGYAITHRLEIHGHNNLKIWLDQIGFYSPKHLEKIRKFDNKA